MVRATFAGGHKKSSATREAREKLLRRCDAQYWRNLPKCVLILLAIKAGQSGSHTNNNPQTKSLFDPSIRDRSLKFEQNDRSHSHDKHIVVGE